MDFCIPTPIVLPAGLQYIVILSSRTLAYKSVSSVQIDMPKGALVSVDGQVFPVYMKHSMHARIAYIIRGRTCDTKAGRSHPCKAAYRPPLPPFICCFETFGAVLTGARAAGCGKERGLSVGNSENPTGRDHGRTFAFFDSFSFFSVLAF